MEEKEPVKMSLLFDPQTGQALSVCQEENADFYFPLVFEGFTFEGEIKDEFHKFGVVIDGNTPIAICYSRTVAYQLADFLNALENRELETVELPYENPEIAGNDKESTHLRIEDYLFEFRELHNIHDDAVPDGGLHKEFTEYVFEKEGELARKCYGFMSA